MRKSQWQLLHRSLLQGGVPFWRVGRTIAEFQDHYYELEAEALNAGLTREEAAADAATRFGDITLLADEYLGRAELTTWWGRLPVVQLCVIEGAVMWQEQSGVAARWCFAMLTAALLTTILMLALRLSIFGGL
jgi:hypothetical protein